MHKTYITAQLSRVYILTLKSRKRCLLLFNCWEFKCSGLVKMGPYLLVSGLVRTLTLVLKSVLFFKHRWSFTRVGLALRLKFSLNDVSWTIKNLGVVKLCTVPKIIAFVVWSKTTNFLTQRREIRMRSLTKRLCASWPIIVLPFKHRYLSLVRLGALILLNWYNLIVYDLILTHTSLFLLPLLF